MNDDELLGFHRDIVAIPSVSHQERALCDRLERWFFTRGVEATRFGDNVWVSAGRGPVLCFNSHLDTVPPSPAWTRPPHEPRVEDGRVFGLGSNDAKASVAAMVAAFLRLRERVAALNVRLVLALTCEEETGGKGAELIIPELRRRGLDPAAAVVGEPTGLDIAIAQKGLLILELARNGKGCHAANARALGVENPIRGLARDIAAIDAVDLGLPHPMLGATTLEPTVLTGAAARNMVPSKAGCVLDIRTNPEPDHATLIARVKAASAGEVSVISDRLKPYEVDPAHPLVRAAQAARPEAKLFGSRTLSDLVFFRGTPAIKIGPGRTERSHTPDEFVLESEILEGARFYEQLVMAFAATKQEQKDDPTLGSR